MLLLLIVDVAEFDAPLKAGQPFGLGGSRVGAKFADLELGLVGLAFDRVEHEAQLLGLTQGCVGGGQADEFDAVGGAREGFVLGGVRGHVGNDVIQGSRLSPAAQEAVGLLGANAQHLGNLRECSGHGGDDKTQNDQPLLAVALAQAVRASVVQLRYMLGSHGRPPPPKPKKPRVVFSDCE